MTFNQGIFLNGKQRNGKQKQCNCEAQWQEMQDCERCARWHYQGGGITCGKAGETKTRNMQKSAKTFLHAHRR
jgi:hypothetical protein